MSARNKIAWLKSRDTLWRSVEIGAWFTLLLACIAECALADVQPGVPDPQQGPSRAEFAAPVKPAVVTVWGREIAVLRATYDDMTPAERAEQAAAHILAIPADAPAYKVEAVKGTEGKSTGAWIKVNGQRVFGILAADVDPDSGESFDDYAAAATANLRQWLALRADQYHLPLLIRALLLAAFATAVFGLAVWGLLWFSRRWLRYREKTAANSARTLRVGDIDVRPYLISLETGLYKLLAWGLGIALGYLWLTYVLNRFPYSQAWGLRLRGFLVDLVHRFGLGILNAVPDLFTVAIIFLLARLVSKVVQAFFRSAERGYIESPFFEPGSARTTRRLTNALIWVFALIVAYPYIPGSETAAFKGVSVFLGLMVSLGSAGIVGQVVGGLVVVYTRAFRVGDHVKVGEHEGMVREIGMLSTKLETRTREEVTIPNAVLIAATTVNYSHHAREGGGAIVTTKLTIGYDTPWRQVHGMLEMAAGRTARIRATPAPWVMQLALSDFYPEYVLIFVIDRSEDRYAVLSELHGHIQDVFNEYGVQIMSPNFEAQPDEPVLSRPGEWIGNFPHAEAGAPK